MGNGEKDRSKLLVTSLLILGSMLLAGCGRDVEVLKEASREPNASLRFSHFRHTVYRGTGQERWEMEGDEAFIYEKSEEVQRIVVYQFSLKQVDRPDHLEIHATRGNVDYTKKIVMLEGECLLKDAEGSIRGERMTYDLDKKVAASSDPVVIDRKGMKANCTGGMIFDRVSDRMTCLRPRGTVIEAPRSPTTSPGGKNSPTEDLFQ